MKYLYYLLSLVLLSVFSACSSRKEISFVNQWDTLRVLKNPHKGWYHHLLDNGTELYRIRNDSVFASFPGMDHLYLRLAWSYLEPEEGKYDWHYIDDVVAKYVPKGYNIAFRITSKETGTYPGSVGQEVKGIEYATPCWVQKAGAKGKVAERRGIRSWVPKWDDPVYLEKLDQFCHAFAERYDGQPWVSYVDIGSIGEWGEGHTDFSTKIPPTVGEVKANMNVYLKNFKNSQLVCNDDLLFYEKSETDVKTLFDYAVANGMTFRDDSPLVDWYLQSNLKTWSVCHPQIYDPMYLKKPIIFELEHYRIVKEKGNWSGKNGADKIDKFGFSGAEIMRKAIETMHATYIGYHGYAEDWLSENPGLTEELANHSGYWYFPVRANIPSTFKQGENSLSFEWLNKGVAPAYTAYELVLRLESENPEKSFDVPPVNSGNLNWLPGIIQKEDYMVKLPAEAAKGDYILKFMLVDKSENNRPVIIGLKQSLTDRNGFIKLGNILLK
jgi:hypothetical protein